MFYRTQHAPDEILMRSGHAPHLSNDRGVGRVLFEYRRTAQPHVQIVPTIRPPKCMKGYMIRREHPNHATSGAHRGPQRYLLLRRQQLNESRRQELRYYRMAYDRDPIVGRGIDMHVELTLSKMILEKPKCSVQSFADYIFDWYQGWAQDVSLFDGTIRENLTFWDSTVPEETLVRACRDRCLVSSGETLFVWLSGLPVQGSYWLKVPARAGQRTAHDAHMQQYICKIVPSG